jgi:di/tricarboxylate transporter
VKCRSSILRGFGKTTARYFLTLFGFRSPQFHIFHYICLAVSFMTIVLWCTLSLTKEIFGDMGFIALFPLVLFLSTGVLTKHDFRERFAWDLVR